MRAEKISELFRREYTRNYVACCCLWGFLRHFRSHRSHFGSNFRFNSFRLSSRRVHFSCLLYTPFRVCTFVFRRLLLATACCVISHVQHLSPCSALASDPPGFEGAVCDGVCPSVASRGGVERMFSIDRSLVSGRLMIFRCVLCLCVLSHV